MQNRNIMFLSTHHNNAYVHTFIRIKLSESLNHQTICHIQAPVEAK